MEGCALTLTTGIPAAAANRALFKADFFYITVFAKVPLSASPAAEVSTAFMSNSGTRCPSAAAKRDRLLESPSQTQRR
jgi:hypothetical protein